MQRHESPCACASSLLVERRTHLHVDKNMLTLQEHDLFSS